jgi:plasmid stability protein
MGITTIRVEQAVRNRLAARAARHGRSLGAELDALLGELDWQAIEVAYQRLAEQPAALASYQEEAESLTSADMDELASSAAVEYPEYNP